MPSRHWQSTLGTIPNTTIGPSMPDECSQERTRDLLDYCNGNRDRSMKINENDVLEYRRTTDLGSTDRNWLNSGLYALLAIKTANGAMASIKSLEEVEVKGNIGWQRLEREARGYHRRRVGLLTESVTHPERVLKVTDLPQAFYRWESRLKEFPRGRQGELDDDVKANAVRHMTPKEILDAWTCSAITAPSQRFGTTCCSRRGQ